MKYSHAFPTKYNLNPDETEYGSIIVARLYKEAFLVVEVPQLNTRKGHDTVYRRGYHMVRYISIGTAQFEPI